MLSGLKRLRLLPALAIWLSVCVPAPTHVLHVGRADRAPTHARVSPWSTPTAASLSSTSASSCSRLRQLDSITEIHAADLNADGELDLVAAGREGLRTWINVRGRFVEHSPTRELLRRHTPPGFTTSRHASHVEDAVLSAERLAFVDDAGIVPFVEARSYTRPAAASDFATRPLDAGDSRAPPRLARS